MSQRFCLISIMSLTLRFTGDENPMYFVTSDGSIEIRRAVRVRLQRMESLGEQDGSHDS